MGYTGIDYELPMYQFNLVGNNINLEVKEAPENVEILKKKNEKNEISISSTSIKEVVNLTMYNENYGVVTFFDSMYILNLGKLKCTDKKCEFSETPKMIDSSEQSNKDTIIDSSFDN